MARGKRHGAGRSGLAPIGLDLLGRGTKRRKQWFHDNVETAAGEPLSPLQDFLARTLLELLDEQQGDANTMLPYARIFRQLKLESPHELKRHAIEPADAYGILATLVRRGLVGCSRAPDSVQQRTEREIAWYFIPDVASLREQLEAPSALDAPKPRSRRSPLAEIVEAS